MTLEFDEWPKKTITHLFYTTTSFVHHFKSIGEFKLELQSANAQFGSKLAIFSPVWPWKLTDDLEKKGTSFVLRQALCITSNPSVNSNWIYSQERHSSCKNWRFFVPRDLEIWWMTLKINRAPLLYWFKLCASFYSHWWIQTGVTVWKRPILRENRQFF